MATTKTKAKTPVQRTKWESMSKKQLEKAEQWKKDGFTIGTNTTRVDPARAEAAVKSLLEFHKLWQGQEFLHFPSINAVKEFLKKNGAEKHLLSYIRGQEETSWITYYRSCEDIFGANSKSKKHILVKFKKKDKEELMLWDTISKTCGWWWPFTKYILMSDRPTEIHFESDSPPDAFPRLHRLNGPCVSYSDGYSIYAIRGVRVPKNVAMGEFTAQDIVKEQNQEVKRCMVELFTNARLIKELNAKLVGKDKFGELYTANIGTDEPLMMVKVIDSTPQPNGTFKEYWLAVDPNAYGGLKTAHAAVASTWRKDDGSLAFPRYQDYQPEIET